MTDDVMMPSVPPDEEPPKLEGDDALPGQTAEAKNDSASLLKSTTGLTPQDDIPPEDVREVVRDYQDATGDPDASRPRSSQIADEQDSST